MPQQKLTIVPVTLHPDSKKSLPFNSSISPSASICMIKAAHAEISFYSDAEEHVIQTIMRELRHL
ncbi:hypothetical protein [Peribacillus frigoritolerans]|uniref:hypothetical protein n=1 Tax=Peribacillus frigoritolerans TaxID=450367 RepID=UPI002231A02D|nr:hypothetical protein [Peribacillus frigoritolerans]UZD48714.1 hypothetical protein OMJ04_09705 [Peribacillus frigoritolerans]